MWNIISDIYLDNLLHRDDVSSVSQADRLLWGEALEALLHHLQTEIAHIVIIIIIEVFLIVGIFTALTSLKSLCSIKIVLVNGTMWLPLASLAGKSGTFTSDWRKKGTKTGRLSAESNREDLAKAQAAVCYDWIVKAASKT